MPDTSSSSRARSLPAFFALATFAIAAAATPVGAQRTSEPQPSPTAAWLLSTAATTVPVALGLGPVNPADHPELAYSVVAAGLILGPAVGYVYGGVANEAAGGALIRGLVLGASVAGAMAACADHACDSRDGVLLNQNAILSGVLILGSIVYTVGSDAVDIIGAGRAVSRHNAGRAQLSVMPAWVPAARAAGVAIRWRPSCCATGVH